jgi:hypothetical protein
MEANPPSRSFRRLQVQLLGPTAQSSRFLKQMLRKIASGFSVFYNVLANDAEGVTYSTMRSFALIERDDWRSIQQDFIDMWRRHCGGLARAWRFGSLPPHTIPPATWPSVIVRVAGGGSTGEEARAAVSIQADSSTRTGWPKGETRGRLRRALRSRRSPTSTDQRLQ